MILKIIVFLMATAALVLSILALTKKSDKFTDKKLTPNDIFFIHVGKSGGSTIRDYIKGITHCHMRKPQLKELEQHDAIILNLRDPISRFVSAFNFSYDTINYDVSSLNENSDLTKTINPVHIKDKITKGYAYNKEYNDLINYFKTPNELAESLTSSNKQKRRKALKLMKHETEHINNSLGWYTNNGKIIKKFHKKIFTISIDNFRNDLENISKKLHNKNIPQNIKIKKKNNNKNKYLSDLARRNLYNFYKDTDYATLDVLYKHNLIDKQLYDKYYSNIFNQSQQPGVQKSF